MQKAILKAIEVEAEKSAAKFQLYHNYLHIDYTRKLNRLKNVPPKNVKKPEEWFHAKKHNPFYVLKHKNKIAYAVAKRIKDRTYKPDEPFTKHVPKKNGGTRTISVFQLQDSAVSDKFYHDLLKKNKHRFSSFSYAYRNDRNVHFAIQDISNELKQSPRIFIAEFDFSNFFGSIDHIYLKRQLKENCFSISATEEFIIEAFLQGSTGIHLGTSISLFLANVACWKLDRKLEDEGLRFARYADDTIIWSKDYQKICKAFDIINEFSKAAGININFSKSDGISLLQKNGMRSEFSHNKTHVDYLGYKLTVESIGIRQSSVKHIKDQISSLLNKNLLQPLKKNPVQAKRFPTATKDEDFKTAISEVRRFLYGNLTEQSIKKYLNGTYVTLSFKGIMSFYPLVDDEEQMKELDRWLISTIMNCLRKRRLLLIKLGYPTDIFPFNLDKDNLIKICKTKDNGKYQIPSFLRICLALKLGIKNQGITKVMHPDSNYYEAP